MAEPAEIRGAQAGLRALFEEVAPAYDRHAALEREVADRLLERAAFQRRPPKRIVDLGCGTGYCAAALKRLHRRAEVIGIDLALAMCRRTRARSGLLRPLRVLCADFNMLPLASRSVDLLVANLAFQWNPEFISLFNGLRRVIRPRGLLLFSSLGPASMAELNAACAAVAPEAGVSAFPDMHDLGDALVAAGFDEPVMDSETITLEYPGFDRLALELEATGAASHCPDWAAVRAAAAALADAWPRRAAVERFPLSWEIVYGAAFGPEEGRPVRTPEGDVATFPVDALRRAR